MRYYFFFSSISFVCIFYFMYISYWKKKLLDNFFLIQSPSQLNRGYFRDWNYILQFENTKIPLPPPILLRRIQYSITFLISQYFFISTRDDYWKQMYIASHPLIGLQFQIEREWLIVPMGICVKSHGTFLSNHLLRWKKYMC